MKRVTLILLALSMGRFVHAQEDTTTGILKQVIITSQRKPADQFYVPYSTQVVDGDYLGHYGPRTTPEALSGITGVFVQKTNHGGGSPFLRGLTGNQTLLMVDGIRLNNSTFRYGPNQYLNTLDAFNIQKMEVVKGTGSVQYGSDAIGGVLQVFTREPRLTSEGSQWSGRALAKYMTGDMEKTVRAEGGYSSKKAAVTIGATYRNFADLIGGDTTGRQSPSGYKELAFDAKAKFLLKEQIELTIAHQLLRQQDVPVYHKVVLEDFAINNFDPQQRMLNYARLNIKGQSPMLNKVELIASWQQTKEGRNSQKNRSSTLRKEMDQVNTIGFTADISSAFSGIWTANSGIELYHDKVNSIKDDININNGNRVRSRGLYPDDARYGNYSLYSLHHFELNKWRIEAGVRYNTFAISLQDTSLGNVRITPSSFVYNGSVLYNISASHNLYATFNTGYRAPNIDDMGTLGIVDFRYELPSNDLAPEKSTNFEVGYKVRTAAFSGRLSGFYMHLSDLITRSKIDGEVINGYPVYRKENVDDAYIRGAEAEALYQLSGKWNVSGNVSYQFGQSLSKKEPLRRIPPMHGRLMTTYNGAKLFLSAEMLYAMKQDRLAQGDKDDNRIPKGGTPGWEVLNLYAGYNVGSLKFRLGALNLFDVDYRTHGSGINGVGRSAWISVEVQL
ncbi:TonB-dependent receptor [Segetibacter sp. 3557_3]|uniref:TonB-dependent receptor plug domain-containing protein n=1 Tax=Segetibacter sp. 3557_3 TaxID=2547429 RepID=UPI001058E343|nr:TonB-dependent receptor [Segetibacter sp. 3557_3]TDH27017.1 TonB-dependent receptor [Segetibacter sp. 3557_3]